MPDTSTRITNLPDSGSAERVAHDIWVYLRWSRPDGQSNEERKNQMLDLYTECLHTVRGLRNPHKNYGDEA